jgi:hypothetical protein
VLFFLSRLGNFLRDGPLAPHLDPSEDVLPALRPDAARDRFAIGEPLVAADAVIERPDVGILQDFFGNLVHAQFVPALAGLDGLLGGSAALSLLPLVGRGNKLDCLVGGVIIRVPERSVRINANVEVRHALGQCDAMPS